ncbi:hypothetical protein KJ365_00550 [Glaciecola sp. XM2]|uniref:hypothetical protein n=1 Tax=Glaciecola sp. XM2 TaxID=1914931 RepID=UPI001BDE59D2|nr:hypothetical protein [Glaciecola sp. XM2]MBT1449355.1 hypothetical protein [Glaciecola sp. XM2]
MNNHNLSDTQNLSEVNGTFVTVNDERYYLIENVDQIPTFFISLISDNDHWMFISSNGALTAGRESSETALFPYECVDKIYDDYLNTGSKTILRVSHNGKIVRWEPFNREHDGIFSTQQNLYKSTLGNKMCFEEINHDLDITFRYYWETSNKFGFVRRCELVNAGSAQRQIDVLDGLQNILPAGTPKFTQTVSSNLVDAYKWSELLPSSTIALYSLYSGITDRAEPCEALKATTVFSMGLDSPTILLSANQLALFKQGKAISTEQDKRGIRGAYFVNKTLTLPANAKQEWMIVANIEQAQTQIAELQNSCKNTEQLADSISQSVAQGSKKLSSIMAAADGFQATNEENVSVHHYANTLFNVLRGGIFNDQYRIVSKDFISNIEVFNKEVYQQHKAFLASLPASISLSDLHAQVLTQGDTQLERLTMEYLPIYFGRRHGDPSRPWNQFLIKLQDADGEPLLGYEGNWRDIFQNWEALSFSYPEYIEGIITKFVNASTIDGYNPYRITKEGIDWEVEEPDDPWSYIGYWGDHQIIYLLKMLEMSQHFHPNRLQNMLGKRIFCYANVPYRIKDFDALLKDAKDTVVFDEALAHKIEKRTQTMGADGKLLLDANGQVYLVNLLEKLLVPLLSKLGNLVIDGGLWLNTQRPEWNDANNALVGQGLSMVTLNYLRRYVSFMQKLLQQQTDDMSLSAQVARWLHDTKATLAGVVPLLSGAPVTPELRYDALDKLGRAASDYRLKVYEQEGFSSLTSVNLSDVHALLADSLTVIDHTINNSIGEDGLYQAYNLLEIEGHKARVNTLYPMLEGQVAALSSGLLDAQQVVKVTDALYNSDIYRPDQKTFLLYPDRPQTKFMHKNLVDKHEISAISSLQLMLENGDKKLIATDINGAVRFNAALVNKSELRERLEAMTQQYAKLESEKDAILALYEKTFDHQSFTGRSGGMFGFEGLGSVYWHMVSKLLLALAENYVKALTKNESATIVHRLGTLYYKVREGIGFNKTPGEYGAFPTDPYSHTPKHAGAQQPGMTGQVKEELISRFTELGIMLHDGEVTINPSLLRKQEFITESRDFWYLDTSNEWQCLDLSGGTLAFTWCQVPFVYQLREGDSKTTLTMRDGSQINNTHMGLSAEQATELFTRSGNITKVVVTVSPKILFSA